MSKLESFVELIVNEENEEASRLLHDWIVEQARNIHQELIAEDDDSLDDEFLGDDEFDLGDAEDEIDSEVVYAEGEEDDELDLGDAEADLETDLDLDAEIAGDEEEVGDIDDDITADFAIELENLEAELEQLKAKFDEISDDEGDDSDDEGEPEEFIDGEELEGDDDLGDDLEGDDEEFEDEDELEPIEESWATDLSKVDAPKGGEEAAVNKQSGLPQKKIAQRAGGEPVQIKGKEHKGYDREAAPSSQVKTGSKKAPQNARSSTTDGNKAV